MLGARGALATLTVVTDRLYFTDAYLSAFDATIIEEADGGRRVYLNRTAFYPTSGGQPNDVGFCNGVRVLDVVDEGDLIAHILAEPLASKSVHCQIDWARRYDHMQQHTGQHLLSAVFAELFHFETLSFHLGADVSSIELGTPELTDSHIDRAQQKAAEFIGEAIPIHAGFEDTATARGLRKQSSRSGMLRIIEIANVDRSACGGTHVRLTSELGPILIRRQEKVRGNIRIEFVCGLRALGHATNDFRLLQSMARIAGAPLPKLPQVLQSLTERLKEVEKERGRLALELAKRDGASFWERTSPDSDGLRRRVVPVETLDEASRAFAQSFVDGGQAVVILTCPQPPSVLLAASPDSGINAGTVLKHALQKCGGHGGGSPKMSQGSLLLESDLEMILRELGFTGQAAETA